MNIKLIFPNIDSIAHNIKLRMGIYVVYGNGRVRLAVSPDGLSRDMRRVPALNTGIICFK